MCITRPSLETYYNHYIKYFKSNFTYSFYSKHHLMYDFLFWYPNNCIIACGLSSFNYNFCILVSYIKDTGPDYVYKKLSREKPHD